MYWVKVVSRSVVKQYHEQKLTYSRSMQVWDEKGQFCKIVTSGRLGKLMKVGFDAEDLTILDPKHYLYKISIEAVP